MKRTVISGLGIISNFGTGKGTTLVKNASKEIKEQLADDGLQLGISAIREELAGRYNLSDWRLMDDLSRYGVLAALLAVEDAEVDLTALNLSRMGVFYGTVFGCVESNVKFHQKLLTSSPRFVSRTTFTNTVSNAAVGQIGLILGAKGMHLTAASGAVYPLIYGIQQIRKGTVDTAIVGGMEKLDPLVLAGLQRSGYGEIRPQDGAGALFIESLDDAARRKGRIHAEIAGFGAAADFATAMQQALAGSGTAPEEVQLIITNENGSKWDEVERDAIRRLFGGSGLSPAIERSKEVTGEAFGASLIFGITAALQALTHYETVLINSATFDSRSKGTFVIKKYPGQGE